MTGSHAGQMYISTASADLSTINLIYNPAFSPGGNLTADATSLYASSFNNVMRVDGNCQEFWSRNYPTLNTIGGMASNGSSLFTAGQSSGNGQFCRIDVVTGNLIW